jgi:hypothetical protein
MQYKIQIGYFTACSISVTICVNIDMSNTVHIYGPFNTVFAAKSVFKRDTRKSFSCMHVGCMGYKDMVDGI